MGNTTNIDGGYSLVEDHPHIHGEHSPYLPKMFLFLGSPPHTWGTLPDNNRTFLVPRITPTYMGNTKS